MKKGSNLSVLFNGILTENPIFVLVLGTCPTLAITTTAKSGVGMGLTTLVVLICSNLFISLLRNMIPQKVRIPAYVMIIATFVSIAIMLLKAYFPELDAALGIYLPLIVVNCIIFARAESFASKNRPGRSVLDGLGMGLGFTAALLIMGSVRELLGAGSWFGLRVLPEGMTTMEIFSQPAGGFFVFGVLMALCTALLKRYNRKPANICGACSMQQLCGEQAEKEERA